MISRLLSVPAVLKAYDQGVNFACGCHKKGLHERVIAGLQSGALHVSSLMVCPLHSEPMVEDLAAEAA